MASSGSGGAAALGVVTGANTGFGREVALALAKNATASAPWHLVLTGRRAADLEAVERDVAALPHVTCRTVADVDFGKEDLDAVVSSVCEALPSETVPSRAVLVHNAGTLGELNSQGVSGDATEIASFRRQMDVNVTSMIALTSAFLSAMGCVAPEFSETPKDALPSGLAEVLAAPKKPTPSRVHVVNVSSLMAVVPVRFHTQYCVAKAARDMAIAVLAKEHDTTGAVVKTLNYAPGPMDTRMQATLRSEASPDRSMWIGMHEGKQMVDTATSATKLVSLLEKDAFASGAHVDFFDDDDEDDKPADAKPEE